MIFKKQLKAHQFYFRNSNFTLSTDFCCKGTIIFSKASLFFSSYLTNQSLIKKQHTFGIEKHLKKAFTVQKLEKALTAKGFLVDNTNKRPIKKREKKRSSLILPKHIGGVFFVHNGKTFSSLQIYKKMLGHKFGEFVSTRKKPVHKKKKQTKNQ